MGQYDLARFHTNFEEHPGGESEASHLSSPATNIARGLAARRLFRAPPWNEGRIHLQTSMSSPEFEPRFYGTVVSDANHYTGRAKHYRITCSSLFQFHKDWIDLSNSIDVFLSEILGKKIRNAYGNTGKKGKNKEGKGAL
ncbi:hypothetical protein TNCV_2128091 [Trichonephila clavipes]|nr:hypothetical protein TNCV_2128091 [Trichonephila clavipes]